MAASFRYWVARLGCAVAGLDDGCDTVVWPSPPPATASVTATDAAATRALAEARIWVRRETVRRGRLSGGAHRDSFIGDAMKLRPA